MFVRNTIRGIRLFISVGIPFWRCRSRKEESHDFPQINRKLEKDIVRDRVKECKKKTSRIVFQTISIQRLYESCSFEIRFIIVTARRTRDSQSQQKAFKEKPREQYATGFFLWLLLLLLFLHLFSEKIKLKSTQDK